jgi:hypothetical protein
MAELMAHLPIFIEVEGSSPEAQQKIYFLLFVAV